MLAAEPAQLVGQRRGQEAARARSDRCAGWCGAGRWAVRGERARLRVASPSRRAAPALRDSAATPPASAPSRRIGAQEWAAAWGARPRTPRKGPPVPRPGPRPPRHPPRCDAGSGTARAPPAPIGPTPPAAAARCADRTAWPAPRRPAPGSGLRAGLRADPGGPRPAVQSGPAAAEPARLPPRSATTAESMRCRRVSSVRLRCRTSMARGPSRCNRVGIAKRGTPGNALAARQIGAWAGDSGVSPSAPATGMGVRAVGGASRRARSTAEARPATVGDSNRAASGKSTPKASHSRANDPGGEQRMAAECEEAVVPAHLRKF